MKTTTQQKMIYLRISESLVSNRVHVPVECTDAQWCWWYWFSLMRKSLLIPESALIQIARIDPQQRPSY